MSIKSSHRLLCVLMAAMVVMTTILMGPAMRGTRGTHLRRKQFVPMYTPYHSLLPYPALPPSSRMTCAHLSAIKYALICV